MFSWWGDFVLALSLLTTLPASLLLPRNSNLPCSAGGSARFFPVVGFIMGLFLCGADCGLFIVVGPILRAALILALDVVITGGLHLDGFIDTCDGLLSRQNREQMLAILRDTHVGGLGAAALGTLLIVKFAALVEISGALRLWALLLFPLVGRLSMSAAVCLFGYARPGAGMGRAYAQETGYRDLAVALLLSILLMAAAFGYIRPSLEEVSIIFLAAAVAVGGSYLLARRIAAKLGGLTGDVYGAVNEVAELLFL
ncbi:MAG: adenosylcobinamide-GDP ribazoletransferase, partial [Firmicutes bacterium]|nr:adenosylcobinamide-GDP ribazoletransferase [Bacillota bacterium]